MVAQREHCCEDMDFFLKEGKVAIDYCPIEREYSIKLPSSSAIQVINYCPWCGTSLPTSLHENYYEILQREYGIDDLTDVHQQKRIPKEFTTDEWWKKRGL